MGSGIRRAAFKINGYVIAGVSVAIDIYGLPAELNVQFLNVQLLPVYVHKE